MKTIVAVRGFRVLAVCVSLVAARAEIAAAPAPAAEVQAILDRAVVLDEGKTTARDAAGAAALYAQAATQGDAFAHLRLGYLYEIGDGVPQDYATARTHYQAASDGGLLEARVRLALCHLEGWGGPVDRAAFVREMRTAAEGGVVAAQKILSGMYAYGFCVPKDAGESVRWLEKAAMAKDPEAQEHMGRTAELQRRRDALISQQDVARTWYQLSAEQEYVSAMRAMARTFLATNKSERDWALGQRWLLLATETGDPEAPMTLAICSMLHPDSPDRDPAKAEAWLKLASERGNPRATEVLQLLIGGKSVTDALRYVLDVPFEERYVQRQVSKRTGAPTEKPSVYRIVKPVYPLTLRMMGTTGKVLVDFVVDTTGRVQAARAIESSHPLFTERAVEAVRQWRFHAGRVDGRLVNFHMQVPVWFTLSEDDIAGADGILNHARSKASELGPQVEADAHDLRLAKPKSALNLVLSPEMEKAGARALILLVLGADGRPIRGHVLQAEPEIIGVGVLQAALSGTYEVRIEDGKPMPTNVVLPFLPGAQKKKQ